MPRRILACYVRLATAVLDATIALRSGMDLASS